MHLSALRNAVRFFEIYKSGFAGPEAPLVVDIGAQDVNGSLRSVCPRTFDYVGVDFTAGRNVDVVLDDPYSLPFATGSIDIVLSNSCFEHAELFWLSFLDIMRVLKPGGLFYLCAPSNGAFHRYPQDCWRFYPDSGHALVTWARRNGVDATLLESFVSEQDGDIWNDFVAVFLRDRRESARHQGRITDRFTRFSNAYVEGRPGILNMTPLPEDLRRLQRFVGRREAGLPAAGGGQGR